jgi:hypothetical protein
MRLLHAITRKTISLETAFLAGFATEEIMPGNKIVSVAECADIRIPGHQSWEAQFTDGFFLYVSVGFIILLYGV